MLDRKCLGQSNFEMSNEQKTVEACKESFGILKMVIFAQPRDQITGIGLEAVFLAASLHACCVAAIRSLREFASSSFGRGSPT